jgi:hypothetical protein
MSPPARTEPSRRLCASSKYGNLPACRAPKHTWMQAPGCTRHPARPTLENESRAADRRVEDVHRRPRKSMDRDASSEKNPSLDQLSRARAPGVATGNPIDLGFQRPGSPPPSILSVGYANAVFGFPPTTLVFSDLVLGPPSYRERVPDLAGFGWSSVLDVAAEDRVPPIRLPRSLGCLETTSNHGRGRPHATVTTYASGPEGPSARWPMWLNCRDVRRGSRRAASRRCHHRHDTPGMLGAKRRNRTPLLPRPDEPFELTEVGARDAWWPRQSRNRPTLHKSQTRQTVRPPSTERDGNRLPPPGCVATRQRVGTTEYRLCTRPPSCLEDSMRGPIPVAGPPGKPDGRSRERPQRQHPLFW